MQSSEAGVGNPVTEGEEGGRGGCKRVSGQGRERDGTATVRQGRRCKGERDVGEKGTEQNGGCGVKEGPR